MAKKHGLIEGKAMNKMRREIGRSGYRLNVAKDCWQEAQRKQSIGISAYRELIRVRLNLCFAGFRYDDKNYDYPTDDGFQAIGITRERFQDLLDEVRGE